MGSSEEKNASEEQNAWPGRSVSVGAVNVEGRALLEAVLIRIQMIPVEINSVHEVVTRDDSSGSSSATRNAQTRGKSRFKAFSHSPFEVENGNSSSAQLKRMSTHPGPTPHPCNPLHPLDGMAKAQLVRQASQLPKFP